MELNALMEEIENATVLQASRAELIGETARSLRQRAASVLYTTCATRDAVRENAVGDGHLADSARGLSDHVEELIRRFRSLAKDCS